MSTSTYARSLLFVFLFVLTFTTIFASKPNRETELTFSFVNDKDSLVLIHQNSKRVYIIFSGDLIKVSNYFKTEKGIFKLIENDKLILTSDGEDISIDLQGIDKIRTIGTPGRRVAGTAIIVATAGILVLLPFAGVAAALPVGVAIYSGYLYFIAAGFGYIIIKYGVKKIGRNFIIERSRWNIQMD
jgi:hypothetical protein